MALCLSARASNAAYMWNGHVRLGLQAGVREEALQAVDTHGPLDGLMADEALICPGLLLHGGLWYTSGAAVSVSVDAALHEGERPEAA